MRLLHVRSLKFQDFNESSLPPYAILSHTWDLSQEVTLEDITSPYLPSKKGYAKVTETCRLALSQGLEYAWIDTCCIDKTSSAELTESINSMFRWYQKARVCYVYLSDLHTTSVGPDLAQCVWFSRGWTLQELLAPLTLEFYNSSWEIVGTKAQLEKDLSSITSIPIAAIRGTRPLRSYFIAQKMSWASKRVTTRPEDMAYCLLGLFDVQMPLIYGEGSWAFHRLQEAIARRTNDLTLFAWVPTESASRYCSLLASSPAGFEQCGNVVPFGNHNARYSLKNKVVKMTAYLLLQPTASGEDDDGQVYRLILPLGYRWTGNGLAKSHISLYVTKLGPGRYIREREPALHELSLDDMIERPLRSSAMETFYLSDTPDPSILTLGLLYPGPPMPKGIYIPHHDNISMSVGSSPICWDARRRLCYWPQSCNDVIVLSFVATKDRHRIHFGLLFDFRGHSECPRCLLIDQASASNRLFFLLFIRTRNQPMKWDDVGLKLPEASGLTNTLKVDVGGTSHEISASIEKQYLIMGVASFKTPTLWMEMRELEALVTGDPKSQTDIVEAPMTAKAKL